MRKLIEMNQKYLIVCDNKNCDFKIPNKTGFPNENIKQFLNVACPKCGKKLLTEEDYLNSLKLHNAINWINWINKWFSWIIFFIPKNKKQSKLTACIHKGISIEIDNN